jgi:hypothetical protein
MGSQRTTPDGRGIRIDAQLINDLRRGINRAQSVDGGRRIKTRQGQSGMMVEEVPETRNWHYPAQIVGAYNSGTVPLAPGAVGALTDVVERPAIEWQDGCRVKIAKFDDFLSYRMGVVLGAIAPGDVGRVAIDGVCLAKVESNDWDLSWPCARPSMGSQYLRTSDKGPVRIIAADASSPDASGLAWCMVLLSRIDCKVVRLVATEDVETSGTSSQIDGQDVNDGAWVLLTAQANEHENGPYEADNDAWLRLPADGVIAVTDGDEYAQTLWYSAYTSTAWTQLNKTFVPRWQSP